MELTADDFRILYTNAYRDRAISQRMAAAEQQELRWRTNSRPAQAGNNRKTVRETVALVESGTLLVNDDLVI